MGRPARTFGVAAIALPIALASFLASAPSASRAGPEVLFSVATIRREIFLPVVSDGAPLRSPIGEPSTTATPGPAPDIGSRPPTELAVHYTDPNELTTLVVDEDRGEVWSGSHGAGLVRWDVRTGTHTRFTAPAELPDNRVFAIATDAAGTKWIGTGAGAVALTLDGVWRDVERGDGTPLGGDVRAVAVGTGNDVWFGLNGSGVRRRLADGSWAATLGARLDTASGDAAGQHLAVELLGAVPVAEVPQIATELAWYGVACEGVRDGTDVRGRIALVQVTGTQCPLARAVWGPSRSGAAAVVLFGFGHALSQVGAVSGPLDIPAAVIDDADGHGLKSRLLRGDAVEARLWDDGLPAEARWVNSLAVDPDGELWIGTFHSGVYGRSSEGAWTHYEAEPPIQVRWQDGGTSYAAFEFFNTPRLAVAGALSGDVAWVGSGCAGEPAFESDLSGRIALFELGVGGCWTEDKLDRFAAAGAVAALGFHREIPPGDLARGGTLSGGDAALPGLSVSLAAAQEMIGLRVRGERVHLIVPPRLSSNCVQAIAVDGSGDHWFGAGDCHATASGTIRGGVTRLSSDRSRMRAYTTFEPVPYRGNWGTYPDEAADHIHAIRFTPDGGLWFATDGGLRRLDADDGTWTDWTRSSTDDGLVDDRVRGLATDREGNVWMATAGGLARLAPGDGAWSRWLADASLPSNWVSAVTVADSGDIWLGTGRRHGDLWADRYDRFAVASGLARVSADGRTWTIYTRESTQAGLPDDRVDSITLDDAGDAWIGTPSGLARLSPDTGAWQAYPADARVVARYGGYATEFVAREPQLGPSAGILTGALAYLGASCAIEAPQQDVRGRVALMDYNDDRDCWMQEHALVAARFGALAVLVVEPPGRSPLSDGEIEDVGSPIAHLRIPVMVLGTDDGAALRRSLLGGTPVEVSLHSGRWWYAPAVTDGMQAPSGAMWFAGNGGASRLENGVWRTWHRGNSPIADSLLDVVTSIAAEPGGALWFGVGGRRVARLAADASRWTTYPVGTSSRGVRPTTVLDVAVDGRGDRWFVGEGGSTRLAADDGEMWHYTRENTGGGLPHNEVQTVAFDRQDNGWFGTAGGLGWVSRDRSHWRHLDVGAAAADAVGITALGDVWVGTAGLGVTRLSRAEPGPDCSSALPLAPGAVVSTTLAGQSDIDLYALTVDRPFHRIELTVPDLADRIDVALRHSCVGIGAGAGRHIGAGAGRHIGAGAGRHIGTPARSERSDRRIVIDALAETGTYYVDVRPRIGTQDEAISYRLRTGLSPVDLESRRTLILTDVDAVRNAFGLAADAPELKHWLDGLRALQADPRAAAMLVTDLSNETDDAVRQAYADWLDLDDPDLTTERANALARALRDWVWTRRATDMPHLQYVVIAGDDRIIPSFRLTVAPPGAGTGWRPEADYVAAAGIDPTSTVGASLLAGAVLTDDVFGAPASSGFGAAAPDLHVPELAVGRLVERPAHMSSVVDGFLATSGAIGLSRSLVASTAPWDDAAEGATRALDESGLPETARTTLRAASWTGADLSAQLRSGTHDFVVAALSGSHDSLLAPEGAAAPADLLASTAPAGATLAVFVASHAGLSVPGPDHARPLDWPEAWLARGGTLVAPAGHAYGLAGELQYSEKLLAHFVRLVTQGDGRVVGDALAAAKQDYVADLAAPSSLHAAAIAGTMLYGLPMARLDVSWTPREPDEAPVSTAWGAEASVVRQDVAGRTEGPAEHLAGGVTRVPVTQVLPQPRVLDTPTGSILDLAGLQGRLEAGEPLQPQVRLALTEMATEGGGRPARGVAWRGGTFRVIDGLRPVVPRAVAASGEEIGTPTDPPSAGRYPALPVAFRAWAATEGVGEVLVSRRDGRLFLSAGQFDAPSGKQRVIEALRFDEYYGLSNDHTAPELVDTRTAQLDGVLEIVVRARDPSGIVRAIAVWSTGPAADGRGSWESVELEESAEDGTWSGRVPAGAEVVLQVVDGAGNVAAGHP